MNLKLIVLALLAMILFINCYRQKVVTDKSESSLVNSYWYTGNSQYHRGDSLRFISENEVNYYMGELGWNFDSEYKITGDTLTIMTISIAFEVDDISGYEPDLIQKYKISKDSLTLVYLANYRNNEWVEADSTRYDLVNNFKRVQ